MTIERGAPWGTEVDRPADLLIVHDDRTLAAALDAGDRPVAVDGGDLHTTVGGRAVADRSRLLAAPIDLVDVELDDGRTEVACAHVVVRSPRRRGSWWRGPILAVMNAEFLGDWDVAPRGHPNDGRVETVRVDPAMSLRDRWSARGRLRHAGHVPHPDIETRSIRSGSWTFERPMDVLVDGVGVGRSSTLAVTVRPDAASLHL